MTGSCAQARLRARRMATHGIADDRPPAHMLGVALVEGVFATDRRSPGQPSQRGQGPCGPVYNVPQMLEDEQVRHLQVCVETTTRKGDKVRVIFQPVTLSRTPARVVTAAPEWGEQTDEILREIGLNPEEIVDLHASQVI